MSKRTITLCMNFHAEGHLARISCESALVAIEKAAKHGVRVQVIAALDRCTDLTRRAVEGAAIDWKQILHFDFGDLGAARNAAIDSMDTDLAVLMDGDDLCGASWILKGYEQAVERGPGTFIHPEFIYYFDASDFLVQSAGVDPNPRAKSFMMRQVPSDAATFQRSALRFNNVYTSNQLGWVEDYRAQPFLPVDQDSGFGVEDWTWNAMTLAAGYVHAVQPETVHLVRVKSEGSLGQQNARQRLLPNLHAAAGLWERTAHS